MFLQRNTMHPSVTVNITLELTLVDLLTKTNYIKYFIEMRLKGHPIVWKQVPFLLKILSVFRYDLFLQSMAKTKNNRSAVLAKH